MTPYSRIAPENVQDLIKSLENASGDAIKWFQRNCMIANPGKFQSIIICKEKKQLDSVTLTINNKSIQPSGSVKLLGIEIDNSLSFESHISSLCRKAAGQLNALFRLKPYLKEAQKMILVNTFVQSNFNYCPLIWHFCSKNRLIKLRIFKRGHYDLFIMTMPLTMKFY